MAMRNADWGEQAQASVEAAKIAPSEKLPFGFLNELKYFMQNVHLSIGERMREKFKVMESRVLAVVLVAALILPGLTALACYSPADAYAVEVVLNKPGVKYDLSKLAAVENLANVSYFGAYSAYVYRSHYDNRLIVVVSEQGLKLPKESPEQEKYFAVRIQIPLKQVDQKLVLAYNMGEEDVRKALKAELRWLLENGIVSGLSEDDIETLVSAAKLGYAGWNSRLAWSEGTWMPYGSIEGAMVLRCVGAPPGFFVVEEGKNTFLLVPIYLAIPITVALLAGMAAYSIVKAYLSK